MRVSSVGFAFASIEEVLREAARTAEVSHNHPEGIKGAQATALAVFLARTGSSKHSIRQEISQRFHYNLDRTIDEIRPSYRFDVLCQGTVPEAIIAFLDSTDYEDAIRKAISLGGDSDTLACITGAIAQGYYKSIPPQIIHKVKEILPIDLRQVVDRFNQRFGSCLY
jgi:ADP-ribosylglycohydrolase